MRISTSYQYDRYARNIQEAQGRYLEAQERVSTGKRITTMSDDPYGASIIINARRLQAGVEQYSVNLRSAKDYFSSSEEALASMSTLVQRAYDLTISAANSTSTQEARDNMAKEISDIQSRLVQLGNTQGLSGQYIFGGQVSNAKPFNAAPPTLNFTGDQGSIIVETGPNETMTVNTNLGSTLTTLYSRLEQAKTKMIAGDMAGLSGISLQDLKSSMDIVRQERASTGVGLQRVQSLDEYNARRKDDLLKQISDVEDVDITEAILQMKATENAYQAALQVSAMGNSMSLMDFIRG